MLSHNSAMNDARPLSELLPTHWQSRSIQRADGTRLHYRRTGGAQPTLVLLHGVQADSSMWLRSAQALEHAYDILMPDARGHGLSARLSAPINSQTLVDDLCALLDALAIELPYVAGHSMGADIAARLAARRPLRAVVLIDPALQRFMAMPSAEGEQPAWMQALFATLRTLKELPHAERLRAAERLLPPGRTITDAVDYVSFVEGLTNFDLNFYSSAAAMGYVVEEPALIAQIACPLLLLTAASALPGGSSAAGFAVFQANWQDGHHVHFADSSHFIPFDQHERFIATLHNFLAAH